MPGDKFIVYDAFSGTGRVDNHTTGLLVKDGHMYSDEGGTCNLGIQVGAALTNTLLSFVFAVSIIVLTILGEDSISTYVGYDYDGVDDLDDCTLFTPSLSYGLAVSLFTEIALMAILIIFTVILTIVGDTECSKPFAYYARVTGTFIALNFFAFLCMTLAMIAFASIVGTSSCCSGSSMLVARLSSFLLVVKVLFIILLYHTH